MTFKQTLQWEAFTALRHKGFRAVTTHGRYEVRSFHARQWTCWIDGLKWGKEKFTSHIKAIDHIERAYYSDSRQLSAVVRIKDRRTK